MSSWAQRGPPPDRSQHDQCSLRRGTGFITLESIEPIKVRYETEPADIGGVLLDTELPLRLCCGLTQCVLIRSHCLSRAHSNLKTIGDCSVFPRGGHALIDCIVGTDGSNGRQQRAVAAAEGGNSGWTAASGVLGAVIHSMYLLFVYKYVSILSQKSKVVDCVNSQITYRCLSSWKLSCPAWAERRARYGLDMQSHVLHQSGIDFSQVLYIVFLD